MTGIHKSGKFERQTCPIRFPMPLGVGNIGYCRGLARACWIDDAPTPFLCPSALHISAAGDFLPYRLKATLFLWQPFLKVRVIRPKVRIFT